MSLPEMSRIPKLSIVVATYRRPDHLSHLLNALLAQTAPLEDFEIIVVDNDEKPDPQVQALCASTRFQNLKYIHHAQLGISNARNRGAQEAHAALVAFPDDDTLPLPDWVTQVFKIRADTKADILGGTHKPFYTSTPPRWFKDKYAIPNLGNHAHWLDGKKALPGGNSIWNRDLFFRLGGFSENFGYVGNKKISGEDNELCQRAHLAGIGIWYDPSLTILHHCKPERMSVPWQLTAIMRHSQMKAHLILRETRLTDKRPVFRQLLTIFKKFLLYIIRFFSACFMTPFRNRKEYPYVENYMMEKIGPELRQISLMFEMMRCLLFYSDKTQTGLV